MGIIRVCVQSYYRRYARAIRVFRIDDNKIVITGVHHLYIRFVEKKILYICVEKQSFYPATHVNDSLL